MCNLFKIVNIRNFLTAEVCHTAVLATVISHLDYANAIMVGLSYKHIAKLQHVQNMAAKVVLKRGKRTSSKDSLQTLHWLTLRSQINFKIAVLVYKFLHGEAPEYLQNLLITYVPGWQGLRSVTIIDRLICLQIEPLVLQAPYCGKVCQMKLNGIKTLNIIRRALKLTYLN